MGHPAGHAGAHMGYMPPTPTYAPLLRRPARVLVIGILWIIAASLLLVATIAGAFVAAQAGFGGAFIGVLLGLILGAFSLVTAICLIRGQFWAYVTFFILSGAGILVDGISLILAEDITALLGILVKILFIVLMASPVVSTWFRAKREGRA